jgi:hypothetical protein
VAWLVRWRLPAAHPLTGTIVLVNPPADLMTSPGGANTAANWDVNGDGINDFSFVDRYPNTMPGGYGVIWQLNMNPAVGREPTNGVISYAGPFIRYVFALGYSATIGPGDSRFSTQTQVTLGSKYSYGALGVNTTAGLPRAALTGRFHRAPFVSRDSRFQAADGTHYGWIRIRVNAGVIDFYDAGYQTTPNESITPTLEPVMPEPRTMALLAMGAVGILGAVTKSRRKTQRSGISSLVR